MPDPSQITFRSEARLRRRRRNEQLFQLAGIAAIAVSAITLIGLIAVIVSGSANAFRHNHLTVSIDSSASSPADGVTEAMLDLETVHQRVIDQLGSELDLPMGSPQVRADLRELVSRLGIADTVRQLNDQDANPLGSVSVTIPVSAATEQYLNTSSTSDTAQGGPLTKQQTDWINRLANAGLIEERFNGQLFTSGDSTYPELAGIAAAMLGSVFSVFYVAGFAIPIGWLAGIYLQEFAKHNTVTRLVELNINNLAAVPPIVFGLLGAAVLINGVRLPLPVSPGEITIGGHFERSLPIVGGFVLAMMILPAMVISTRAALMSVPQDVRDSALAIGATPQQSVFHHVVPLAAQGILTGTLLNISRVFGETAPLLLLGTVAFFADIPSGPNEPATMLPVLIYRWASDGDVAWEPMAAAAALILLAIVLLLNGIAAYLRRRIEIAGGGVS